MGERTMINGWTISSGDYLRDPEYDNEFLKGKTKKKLIERTVFSVSAVLAVVAFIGAMSMFKSLLP